MIFHGRHFGSYPPSFRSTVCTAVLTPVLSHGTVWRDAACSDPDTAPQQLISQSHLSTLPLPFLPQLQHHLHSSTTDLATQFQFQLHTLLQQLPRNTTVMAQQTIRDEALTKEEVDLQDKKDASDNSTPVKDVKGKGIAKEAGPDDKQVENDEPYDPSRDAFILKYMERHLKRKALKTCNFTLEHLKSTKAETDTLKASNDRTDIIVPETVAFMDRERTRCDVEIAKLESRKVRLEQELAVVQNGFEKLSMLRRKSH
ncbi:hypothetical protein QC762_0081660 [Podospora pseudocomata]|uniref:Uncharacterized protein n=1 Tax=Podospora pseudocomata TaxID=2093779 RepID=A0ABR0GC07_9PEZI|nr:hypothetical protein QC762_0081660 [Podospora pseudocomata]